MLSAIFVLGHTVANGAGLARYGRHIPSLSVAKPTGWLYGRTNSTEKAQIASNPPVRDQRDLRSLAAEVRSCSLHSSLRRHWPASTCRVLTQRACRRQAARCGAWLESDAPFVGIASSSNRLIHSQKSVPLIASTLRPLSVCGSSPATLRPPSQSHPVPCRNGRRPHGRAVDAERGFEAAHGRRRDGDGADG